MSDDCSLEEEVLRENGMTREQWMQVKLQRDWDNHQMDTFMQGSARLSGKAKTMAEFRADKIDKEIGEKRAERAKEQENIEGYLRVLHPDSGEEYYLKVMVDTGATVSAITYGMLIDSQLENRKIKLDQAHVLYLAVGKFECGEQISLQWMGKGCEEHGTTDFYLLPRGQANITDRVILSKEWLNKRGLLYDKDAIRSLKTLIGGKQSANEKVVGKQEHQQAMDDRASSSKAKDAYQSKEGQKKQVNPPAVPSRPKEASK